MLESGDPIVTYVDGQPDNYNSKPPLVVWTQALSLWIFGKNEVAARLPSAVAAFLTCLLLFEFIGRKLNDYRIAFVSIISLASSTAWLGYHGVRFAETDSTLFLFTTSYLLVFFEYLNKRSNRLLALFWILVLCAVFSKGIVGLIFFGAIFLYLLWKRALLTEIKKPLHWIMLVISAALVFSYYFIREKLSPGYLEAVWINELGGRVDFTEAQLQHPVWYYFKALALERFAPWIFLVPIGIFYSLRSENQSFRSLGVFSSIMAFWFLLVMSIPEVKNSWYDLPALPFLAILSGIGLIAILKLVLLPIPEKRRNFASVIIVLSLCAFPIYQQRSRYYKPKDAPWDRGFYSISHYLRDSMNDPSLLEGKSILYRGYHAHHLFYLDLLEDRNASIDYQHDQFNVEIGDQVIYNQDEIKQMLEASFECEVVETQYELLCYRILSAKTVKA